MSDKTIRMVDLVKVALAAGERILNVYDANDFEVEMKDDQSPLTVADKESHQKIAEELGALYPDIPILSEEGNHVDYQQRKDWEFMWLIDPLDGTKEFIKRNDEFTVNIGLVKDKEPVLGVIYAPVFDIVFFGNDQIGSFKLTDGKHKAAKLENDDELIHLSKRLPLSNERESFVMLASRSHFTQETEEFIEKVQKKYRDIQLVRCGSSLKMCWVAEGKADIYPRFSPSMEWDTAAGEAIVRNAGGVVYERLTKQRLKYNKANLENPHHIVKFIRPE